MGILPSTESGNLPNDVWAAFESNAYESAVKPIFNNIYFKRLVYWE
jgi:hypothetical protein